MKRAEDTGDMQSPNSNLVSGDIGGSSFRASGGLKMSKLQLNTS